MFLLVEQIPRRLQPQPYLSHWSLLHLILWQKMGKTVSLGTTCRTILLLAEICKRYLFVEEQILCEGTGFGFRSLGIIFLAPAQTSPLDLGQFLSWPMPLLAVNKAFLFLSSPIHLVYLDSHLPETWATSHPGFSLHIAQWSPEFSIKIEITLTANGYYNRFERSTHRGTPRQESHQGEGKLETGPAGRKGNCLQSTELLLYNLQI